MWFKVLSDLTPKALESGIERLHKTEKFLDYPPNPLQFRALCLAFYEELKLPTAASAYQEIKSIGLGLNSYAANPIIRFIASKLPEDFFLLQEQAAYRVFERVYSKVCHLVKQGHPLPQLKKEKQFAKKPINHAVGQAHLQKIKILLGG